MYHISNYGFADPNYMEHYGVKGMKWKNHRYVTKNAWFDTNSAKSRGSNTGAGSLAKRDYGYDFAPSTQNNINARTNGRGIQSSAGRPFRRNTWNALRNELRNPQKTDRREYGANRRAQARTSTAKSDKMAPINMMARRMDRQGGNKALGNREFDSLKNWMPKSRGRAEQPWSMDRWTQERYSRPNNGRRRRR